MFTLAQARTLVRSPHGTRRSRALPTMTELEARDRAEAAARTMTQPPWGRPAS